MQPAEGDLLAADDHDAGVRGAALHPFSRFKKIGDIAGGRGHLLKALLEQQPSASGVLFELPHVIAEAKGKLPDRIELVAGDFFKDKLPSCDA